MKTYVLDKSSGWKNKQMMPSRMPRASMNAYQRSQKKWLIALIERTASDFRRKSSEGRGEMKSYIECEFEWESEAEADVSKIKRC